MSALDVLKTGSFEATVAQPILNHVDELLSQGVDPSKFEWTFKVNIAEFENTAGEQHYNVSIDTHPRLISQLDQNLSLYHQSIHNIDNAIAYLEENKHQVEDDQTIFELFERIINSLKLQVISLRNLEDDDEVLDQTKPPTIPPSYTPPADDDWWKSGSDSVN